MILYPTLRRELGYIDNNYDTAHDAAEAEYAITPTEYACVGQLNVTGYGYRICRGVLKFDLSSLSPTEDIFYATLMSSNYSASNPFNGCVLDGTGLTGVVSDWGLIKLLTTLLGLASFPGDNPYHIIFNEAGRQFLKSKAGGIVTLALRGSTDIEASPPAPNKYEEFYVQKYPGTQLLINVPGGYIWVEGTNFAYTDSDGTKRLKEGTLTGTTGKIAGHYGVEGDYLHYIDSSGNERRILGTVTALTGKIPSQISINRQTPMLGTNLCYIDSSGNERCFKGTVA